jgi:hypothetical protein
MEDVALEELALERVQPLVMASHRRHRKVERTNISVVMNQTELFRSRTGSGRAGSAQSSGSLSAEGAMLLRLLQSTARLTFRRFQYLMLRSSDLSEATMAETRMEEEAAVTVEAHRHGAWTNMVLRPPTSSTTQLYCSNVSSGSAPQPVDRK